MYIKETIQITVQTIQNNVSTSTHTNKHSRRCQNTPHTHTLKMQHKLKHPQYKIHTKWN